MFFYVNLNSVAKNKNNGSGVMKMGLIIKYLAANKNQ